MRISCYGNIPFLIDLKQEPLKPPVLIPLPLRDKCFGNEFGREIRLESSLRTAQKGRSLMSIFNMNDKQIRIPNQVDFPKSHKQFNGSAGSCFRSIQGKETKKKREMGFSLFEISLPFNSPAGFNGSGTVAAGSRENRARDSGIKNSSCCCNTTSGQRTPPAVLGHARRQPIARSSAQ
ncbi:uncharacterized protein LOC116258447 isoform X2 [Nymphaea colorata]|uniref:uncharacterized protein LOC116258447 isoform X2 n=1 Tax=Nymphaea colorata TaxID=210225 RepID=UPI00214EA66F|nr:uncharacterized protein LOC116258447 isoform X2 [Nymphaea colorata]